MTTGENEEIKVEKTPGDSGIRITPTESELAPPLTEDREREEARIAEEEVTPKKIIGKMPISPIIIKPPLRFETLALQEATGYPVPIWSEEDIEDLANFVADLGLEMHPGFQVLLSMVTAHAAWFLGFSAWRRAGRPGDLKRGSETGEVAKTERPGEEIKQ